MADSDPTLKQLLTFHQPGQNIGFILACLQAQDSGPGLANRQ